MFSRLKAAFAGIAIVALLGVFSGCSSDGVTVATYSDGKQNHSVKIKDIKEELMSFLSRYPGIAGDTNWHIDYIFNRYIAIDLANYDEMSKGITNQPEYKEIYTNQLKKEKMIILNRYGREVLNEEAKKAKFEYVKASHILLMTSRYTNVNGRPRELSNYEFGKLVSEKEALAKSLIVALKASTNLESDFSNSAVLKSEDGGSSFAGGDVGYFTRGLMVKEFEDASFGAAKKGLIEKPVKTDYGFHIIYVKDPVRKGSMNEIKNLVGTNSFARIEPGLRANYYNMNREKSIKNLYTVDTNKGVVVVDGKGYDVKKLPDSLKMFSVYGLNYSWKDCRDVFDAMIPNFVKDMNLQSFSDQMENLKDFMQFVEIAKNKGYEKSPRFTQEVEKKKAEITKIISAQFFQREFMTAIKKQMTDDSVRKFYDANKAGYVKDVNGKKVQKSFQEAEPSVRDDLEKRLTQEQYGSWSEVARKKYKVFFPKDGLKALENMEKKFLKEEEKRNRQQGGQLQIDPRQFQQGK